MKYIVRMGKLVRKIIVTISLIVILVSVTLVGCLEEQKASTADGEYKKIILESNIVELSESSMDIITDQRYDPDCECSIEFIRQVDVSYLFRNIAGRDVSVRVTVEFYDKDDNLLGIGGVKTINLLKGYTEKAFTPANTISYNGKKVADVHHVKIIAEEA